jgi:hypothetical protein
MLDTRELSCILPVPRNKSQSLTEIGCSLHWTKQVLPHPRRHRLETRELSCSPRNKPQSLNKTWLQSSLDVPGYPACVFRDEEELAWSIKGCNLPVLRNGSQSLTEIGCSLRWTKQALPHLRRHRLETRELSCSLLISRNKPQSLNETWLQPLLDQASSCLHQKTNAGDLGTKLQPSNSLEQSA